VVSYYARFEKLNGKYFRFDTRIYLCDGGNHREEDGECVGAVVGLNPGSARPLNESDVGKWAEIKEDSTLRIFRRCFLEAAEAEAPREAFVQG
jgi:hypothetical protein